MTYLPPGFAWVQDRDFLWVAAGQFLLALGVREETVRPLGQLRPLYEKWEQVETELLGPAAGASTGISLHLLDDRQRAELDNDIARALAVLVPIAEEVLQQLDRQRIRAEILGYRRESLDGALADLRAYAADEGWRGKDETAIEERLRWIESRHRMETPPVKASAGEVRRIVAILRRMPRRTLRRITKVTSTPALMALVGSGLTAIRSSGTGGAAGGDVREDDVAAGGPTGSDAPTRADLPRPSHASSSSREGMGGRVYTNGRQRTQDDRWSLIGRMSLAGLAPTIVLVGGLVLGAGMLTAGALAAVAGVLALVVLTAIAVGRNKTATARQQTLRSVTVGGMLAVWGTWNAAVGLVPLIYALVEELSVLTAVLGGILILLGGVLGIVGAVQRVFARRRAGLPDEDYDIPVGMVP